MKYLIVLMLTIITLAGFGQAQVTEEFTQEIPTRVFYQPIFSDSTTLFFSNELVWTCKSKDGFEYSYYQMDFSQLISCECNRELYKKIPSNDTYVFEIEDKKKKATLEVTAPNQVKYTQYDDDGINIYESNLFYDITQITFIDSSYTEDIMTGDFKLTITNYFKMNTK